MLSLYPIRYACLYSEFVVFVFFTNKPFKRNKKIKLRCFLDRAELMESEWAGRELQGSHTNVTRTA